MIGEGIHSTNQRNHTYVQDRVEVGFFTDPSVCIGCKACEVACKEWNQVPDDGFTWSGNSYDNTGHLGASTWRHVMFLDRTNEKETRLPGQWVFPIRNPVRSDWHFTRPQLEEIPFVGSLCPTLKHCEEARCLERVRLDRSCGPKSCPFSCRTMSATAAAIVSFDVPLAY